LAVQTQEDQIDHRKKNPPAASAKVMHSSNANSDAWNQHGKIVNNVCGTSPTNGGPPDANTRNPVLRISVIVRRGRVTKAPWMDTNHGVPTGHVVNHPEILIAFLKRNLLIVVSYISYRDEVDYPLPSIESASDANTAQKSEDVLGIKTLTLWGNSENALTVA
jgi:hypothetical protein